MHTTRNGLPARDFTSLTSSLASRSRVRYRLASKSTGLTFKRSPNPTLPQKRAYELLGLLPVGGKRTLIYLQELQPDTVSPAGKLRTNPRRLPGYDPSLAPVRPGQGFTGAAFSFFSSPGAISRT
jgi:hypothetical protein